MGLGEYQPRFQASSLLSCKGKALETRLRGIFDDEAKVPVLLSARLGEHVASIPGHIYVFNFYSPLPTFGGKVAFFVEGCKLFILTNANLYTVSRFKLICRNSFFFSGKSISCPLKRGTDSTSL